jgi:hypothetical protein
LAKELVKGAIGGREKKAGEEVSTAAETNAEV